MLNPESFTENEHKFLWCMGQVDPDTIWGTAIKLVYDDPTVPKVRALIGQLKSQANDNNPMIKEILGDDCYEALLAI